MSELHFYPGVVDTGRRRQNILPLQMIRFFGVQLPLLVTSWYYSHCISYPRNVPVERSTAKPSGILSFVDASLACRLTSFLAVVKVISFSGWWGFGRGGGAHCSLHRGISATGRCGTPRRRGRTQTVHRVQKLLQCDGRDGGRDEDVVAARRCCVTSR